MPDGSASPKLLRLGGDVGSIEGIVALELDEGHSHNADVEAALRKQGQHHVEDGPADTDGQDHGKILWRVFIAVAVFPGPLGAQRGIAA